MTVELEGENYLPQLGSYTSFKEPYNTVSFLGCKLLAASCVIIASCC